MCRKLSVFVLLALGLAFASPVPTGARSSDIAAGEAEGLPAPWIAGAGAAAGTGDAAPAEADQDDPPTDPGYIPDHLIVQFAPGTSAAVKQAVHERFGAQVIREIPALGVQVLRLSEDAIAMVSVYQSQPEVSYAEPDYLATIYGAPDGVQPVLATDPLPADGDAPHDTPSEPLYAQQWHHAKIDSPRAWDFSHGQEVIVAIVDTGVDCNHPDLRGKCLAGYDHFNNDSDPGDDHGHGTHVAGIAASLTNNGIGGAGTGWDARVMPVKALGSAGNGGLAAIANSIVWATDNGADVINMSLGGFFTSRTLQNAAAYAIERDVTLVAAAGNESTSNPTYPASYPGVIGIAATTQSDTRASFSNFGSYVDVAAPGAGILSTIRGGSYAAWSGTSMASPVAAGVAALLKQQGPCRKPADIERILEQTADDLGTRGPDQYFGAGRINAGRALALETDPCGGAATPGPGQTPSGPQVPTATPRPTTALPTQAPDSGGWDIDLEGLINRQRVNFGLPPLRGNTALRRAAGSHATDMAVMRRCTHTGSDGSDPFGRMEDNGYAAPYGEIVACGQTTPEAAVAAWMNSAGHRAIILCTSCTELGGGYRLTSDGYRFYWVANFGAGRTSAPSPTLPPLPSVTPTATRQQPTATRPPATPLPTTRPGSVDVILKPAPGRIGWVVGTEQTGNHFDSSYTYTGAWNDRIYHGAMQIDLDPIPPGAYINFARLTLTSQTAEHLAKLGTWSVNLLGTEIDPGFENHAYPRIHAAGIEAKLLPLMNASDLAAGQQNVFSFSPAQLAALQARLGGSRRISFRMDGPTGGDFSNLATWDSGQGPETQYPGPELYINYQVNSPDILPTRTATVPLPPSATPLPPTAGPSPTASRTIVPPAPTGTPPPPRPTGPSTATLVPPFRTPPTPGASAIEIPALPQDVGWARQFEPRNHLGEGHTYAGVYQGLQYYGMAQFDLSAIPDGVSIQEARLTLTGASTTRLSQYGNGQWEIRLLQSDIDAGWAFHTFDQLTRTRELADLHPVLRQSDLDAGKANVFLLRTDEIRELEWRVRTTGKISFRFDGPRTGPSNIFDWDAGQGGEPPRLSVIYGPRRADNPVPDVPSDEDRIERVIESVNRERVRVGLAALAVSPSLRRAAERHSWDMTMHRFFDHTGTDGSTPAGRVAEAGFRAAAVEQLIAGNSGSVDMVVGSWMGSAQHRNKLLDPDFTHVGAFYDYSPSAPLGHYWTVVLAQAGP
jgi:thermitase